MQQKVGPHCFDEVSSEIMVIYEGKSIYSSSLNSGCGPARHVVQREEAQVQAQNYATMTQKMYITIDGRTESVTLADNNATQALVGKLQKTPVTVTLSSNGGFEICGALAAGMLYHIILKV